MTDPRLVPEPDLERLVPGRFGKHRGYMALLKGLPLDGAVITGDAIFTQRELCRAIRDGGGHYLFVVKDNQPQLKAGIAEAFGDHSPLGPAPRRQRAAT